MARPAARAVLPFLAVLLLAAAPPTTAAKDDVPRVRRSAEFKYVDESDAEKAAALLPALLKKYDTPKKCEGLLKALHTKRSYPGKVPGSLTLDHACTDGRTRQFTVIAPPRYSKGRPAGVMIFLHGAVSQPAPGGGANEGRMFAPAVKDLGFIVVGPSTYDRVGWDVPACRELVHHALDFVKQYYNVDENRVYVAGDSDGGRGTYNQIETEATFLAAAVPVIGAPGAVTRFVNFKNVPIFAINGETDSIFKIEDVRRLVEGMKAAGIDLTYKEIAGQGHDPYFFLKYQEEIRDFFEKHERDPFPKTVHWQIDPGREDFGRGFPADTFRWIRIVEAGEGGSHTTFPGEGSLVRADFPRVEASYEGNRIEVKTSGVKRYAVLVSPDMLDLTREVEVVTNGKPSFQGIVEADARVILEEARRFKDRKLVFANRIEITVE